MSAFLAKSVVTIVLNVCAEIAASISDTIEADIMLVNSSINFVVWIKISISELITVFLIELTDCIELATTVCILVEYTSVCTSINLLIPTIHSVPPCWIVVIKLLSLVSGGAIRISVIILPAICCILSCSVEIIFVVVFSIVTVGTSLYKTSVVFTDSMYTVLICDTVTSVIISATGPAETIDMSSGKCRK